MGHAAIERAIRAKLPRHPGKKPVTDGSSWRCWNCNARMPGHEEVFYCDRLCLLEWRARLALWEWNEAREDD